MHGWVHDESRGRTHAPRCTGRQQAALRERLRPRNRPPQQMCAAARGAWRRGCVEARARGCAEGVPGAARDSCTSIVVDVDQTAARSRASLPPPLRRLPRTGDAPRSRASSRPTARAAHRSARPRPARAGTACPRRRHARSGAPHAATWTPFFTRVLRTRARRRAARRGAARCAGVLGWSVGGCAERFYEGGHVFR